MRRRRRRPVKAERKVRTRKPRGPRIRCPQCNWEPDGGKYWGCDKCSAVFDTFKTRAHCPQCPQSWTWTQCIRCHEISDHEAWYVEERKP